MSQIDDLRARIDRALEEAERLSGSLREIDALKSALGEANSRLTDNADQIGRLASATETFRGAVERATNELASVAEELSGVDAAQIGREISKIERNLKDSIEANSSMLTDRLVVESAEVVTQMMSGLNRLDNGIQRLLNDVRSSATNLTDLIEGVSRLIGEVQSETQARANENSRRLDEIYIGLINVARNSARSRTKWMIALLGANLVSTSVITALMLLYLG